MSKEEWIENIVASIDLDIQRKDFLTYKEKDDWKEYITDIINGIVQQENEQLKERIDKAIEYIKSFGISDNDLKGLGECPITMNDLCKLLKILKGE